MLKHLVYPTKKASHGTRIAPLSDRKWSIRLCLVPKLCLKPCVGPGKGREECKSADGCSRLEGRSGHREGRI